MDGRGAVTLADMNNFINAPPRAPDAPLPSITAHRTTNVCADGREARVFVNAVMGG